MNPAEILEDAGEGRHVVHGLNPSPTTQHASGKRSRSLDKYPCKSFFSILRRSRRNHMHDKRCSADLVAYLFK